MTAGGGTPLWPGLAEQLRARLHAAPPAVTEHDDYDLTPDLRPERFGARKAAVLLPLIARDEPRLLFTRRTEGLARHPGQVSFPGGRSEPGDLSPVATALRETFEEIGLGRDRVEIIGRMPDYVAGTGFASRRCSASCGRAFP